MRALAQLRNKRPTARSGIVPRRESRKKSGICRHPVPNGDLGAETGMLKPATRETERRRNHDDRRERGARLRRLGRQCAW